RGRRNDPAGARVAHELLLGEALGRDEPRQHEADVDAVRLLLEVQRVGPAGDRELRRRVRAGVGARDAARGARDVHDRGTHLLRPMRQVLVAPDAFKGTFAASEVAAAIGRGLERAGFPPPDVCPVADGGEGTMAALLTTLGGETGGAEVSDPLGRPVQAGFALIEEGTTAIVEVAEASGLTLVAEEERDAEAASSRGTGELIVAAGEAG